MTTTKRTQLSAFASLAFGQGQLDAFRMDEPRMSGSTICGITSLFGVRGPLFEDDKGGGGGGGEPAKTFTQDEVNRIVTERVGKMKTQLDAATAALGDLESIKTKLAQADEERQTALEAKELEGKSELDKLKIQLQKATDKSKLQDSEWQKRVNDAEAKAAEASGKHQDYVKRSHIQTALSKAGLAKGADKSAVLAFLAEAQSELDENLEFKSVAVGGKSFSKLDDAAKQFLADNPYFAGASPGGSGGPRNPGNAGNQPALEQHTNVESLLAAGLSARSSAQS